MKAVLCGLGGLTGQHRLHILAPLTLRLAGVILPGRCDYEEQEVAHIHPINAQACGSQQE